MSFACSGPHGRQGVGIVKCEKCGTEKSLFEVLISSYKPEGQNRAAWQCRKCQQTHYVEKLLKNMRSVEAKVEPTLCKSVCERSLLEKKRKLGEDPEVEVVSDKMKNISLETKTFGGMSLREEDLKAGVDQMEESGSEEEDEEESDSSEEESDDEESDEDGEFCCLCNI